MPRKRRTSDESASSATTTASRRRSRRRRTDIDAEEEEEERDEAQINNTSSSRSRGGRPSSASHAGGNDGIDEDEDDGGNKDIQFSQQAPEPSQPLHAPKANEESNFSNLNAAVQERLVTDLSRLLLFSALNKQPIDRTKIVKETLGENNVTERVATAVLSKAEWRLKNVFGFELRQAPKFMEDSLPPRFKARMYVVNQADLDDEAGSHSRALHSVHSTTSSVERGVLMLILAFAFCKGDTKISNKAKTKDPNRWISAEALYRLLHSVDENIPSEPPNADEGGTKKKAGGASALGADAVTTPSRRRSAGNDNNLSLTPNIDVLLDTFVQQDYLLREKINPSAQSGSSSAAANSSLVEGSGIMYAMGPRAAMEIGRRQVVHFCAEILDEQPDPTMLAEIEEGEEEDEELGGAAAPQQ
uniref:MAGE domain-containing protein n=1 Tax=Ditylum brightwellii TaxID=49249 RepID=A0A7S4RVH7_9STRA|mmetsp:Transcript_10721/g.15908  ORF Transcript_10721/g.15908 Transcript_10721/m.15908 type:complete len:416 (-) Transcript_10721:414-1661(-)